MRQAISPAGANLEYLHAMKDQQAVAHEYGNPVTITLPGETEVVRDAYGSISSRATEAILNMNAAQIDYQPSQRQRERAGLRETCDAIAYFSMQDWLDAGYRFDDIDCTRMLVRIDTIPGEETGTLYDVREKGRSMGFASGYLCITLGLSKR